MKAVTFRDFGGPEVLELAEVDRPEPGADDVMVRVQAAGICYHDVLSRAGRIPGGRPGGILGHEIGQCRRGSLVRHHQRVETGVALQEFDGEMAG